MLWTAVQLKQKQNREIGAMKETIKNERRRLSWGRQEIYLLPSYDNEVGPLAVPILQGVTANPTCQMGLSLQTAECC